MKLKLRKIKLETFVGIYKEEKENPSNLMLDLDISFNYVGSDDIENTISYEFINKDIKKALEDAHIDLIEEINFKIANFLMNKYQQIDEMLVRVFKNEAPVKYSFESISVEEKYKREEVVLNIGSNLNNKNNNINKAIEEIKKYFEIKTKLIKKETKAYGNEKLNDFVNQTIVIESINYNDFKNKMNMIINTFSKHQGKWNNREVDIDVILYGNNIIEDQNFVIPHYDIENREFIINDLYKLFPRGIHPRLNTSWYNLKRKKYCK